MTQRLAPEALAQRINERFPTAVQGIRSGVVLHADQLLTVCDWLSTDPDLAFDSLSMVTAVDLIDEETIELVYVITSTFHNTMAVLKVRTADRDDPASPSVVSIWRTAEFQENEIYDLFGVRFAGHPSLHRIFLWEEFRGHPLRKDFLPMAQ